MLWTIAVILFILWILGFFIVHVGGGLLAWVSQVDPSLPVY